MHDLVIKPEQALQLQQSGQSIGLTVYDIDQLTNRHFLSSIFPILVGRSGEDRVLPAYRIRLGDTASADEWVERIAKRGKTVTEWARELLSDEAYLATDRAGTEYDVYLFQIADFGFSKIERYPRVLYEKRAKLLGFDLVPPIVALEAFLELDEIGCCHVGTEPRLFGAISADYFYIPHRNELHTTTDRQDTEEARAALLEPDQISSHHQWLFFKEVS